MFRLIAIDLSQKSPHFSLLSPTSPCELSEREVTSPSNLKVLFLVSCPKGQVEKYVNVEAWAPTLDGGRSCQTQF
jgi:hypothetical protein